MNIKQAGSLLLILILGLGIGLFMGQSDKSNKLTSPNLNGGSNDKLVYGDTGLPKNCRAIIKENIDDYKSGKYSASDVLDSIDRNCGEFGYAW